MGDNKPQDEAWDFKVDGEEITNEEAPVKKKKAPLKNLKVEKKMGLDFEAMPDRVTRTQQANVSSKKKKKIKKKKRPNYPGLIQRVQAFIIDVVMMGGVVIALYLYDATLFDFPPEYKTYIAHRFRAIVASYGPVSAIVIGAHLLMNVFVATLLRRSIGKMMSGIIICSKTGTKAGFIQVFYRELFAKPISVTLLIGPLLFLFNKRKRSLHDFIAGTCLYKG